MTAFNETLQKLQNDLGLNQVQIGPLSTPLTISFYEKWIGHNFHGQMSYLKDHLAQKKNPQLLNQNLNSVITVTQAYFPTIEKLDAPIPARTATYSQNKDYHFWLKEKLQAIITELKKSYPEHEFLPFVDSGPVLERNWAYENGMGWFGKNTCLIHPQFGSLFFIAEILTTIPLNLENKIEPLPDFCGKCRKCIEICPTQALAEPHVLKAELCISYLTIESKTNPPIELRPKMTDWFFGCDLCQTVCPWNEKVFRKMEIPVTPATNTAAFLNLSTDQEGELTQFFKELLPESNKQIAKKFYGTPLFRAGGNGLKRNALIVIANRKMVQLKAAVEPLTAHPKLAELAVWCLSELSKAGP